MWSCLAEYYTVLKKEPPKSSVGRKGTLRREDGRDEAAAHFLAMRRSAGGARPGAGSRAGLKPARLDGEHLVTDGGN